MDPSLLNNALVVLLLQKVGPTFTASEADIRRASNRTVRVEPARTSNGVTVTLLTDDPMVLARVAKADMAETAAILASNPRDPGVRSAHAANVQALGRILAGFSPDQLRTFAETGDRRPTDAELVGSGSLVLVRDCR